jgi:SsrA-binding protein
MSSDLGFKSIVNRRATYEYQILETLEAGLVLSGPETKSVRLGHVSLAEAFAVVTQQGEVQLLNAHINPYPYARQEEYEPRQTRRLLLHKREIERLMGKIKSEGVTLVPLKIYQKHGKFKVELGLARGKKQHEKRETIKRRDVKREIDRAIKGYR